MITPRCVLCIWSASCSICQSLPPLSALICQCPASQGSHVVPVRLYTQQRAGAEIEQRSPCLAREEPLTVPLSTRGHRIPISCSLSREMKLNFTYQQHSENNKEAPACGACSNSTAQWTSSPVKNPWDNPMINIHSLFFSASFSSSFLQKRSGTCYPRHYCIRHLNGLFCTVMKAIIRSEWGSVSQRLIWTLVGFT